MTATDELRRLLDECGVEWTVPDDSWNQDSITYWKVGSIKWVAFESENDTLWLNCNSVTDLAPAQAIAATLGRGECEMEYVNDWMGWHCKSCDNLRMGLPDQKPNFCPNCGRKVIG